MKRLFIMSAITVLCLCGCKTASTDSSSNVSVSQSTSSVISSTNTMEEETKVMPENTPVNVDDNKLESGVYSVSFDPEKDLIQTDNGYSIHLKVYDYDKYKLEDIEKLKEGDTITVGGEDMKINTLEFNTDSAGEKTVSVNGGVENNGIDLIEENGVYRTLTMDIYPLYNLCGEITLAVSKNLTVEDFSLSDEATAEPAKFTYNDIPSCITESENKVWSENATTVTVDNNEITNITRNWTA